MTYFPPFSFIDYNEYNTIIDVTTPVPTMDNIYTNTHVDVMHIKIIINKKVQTYRQPYRKLDKVLHRQVFALHTERLIACHMCIRSKSKTTTFTLRLSVFYCQNRLITEPVRLESGQFLRRIVSFVPEVVVGAAVRMSTAWR